MICKLTDQAYLMRSFLIKSTYCYTIVLGVQVKNLFIIIIVRKIIVAGKLMVITSLDHIIISKG